MLAPLFITVRAGFVSNLILRRCCPAEIEFLRRGRRPRLTFDRAHNTIYVLIDRSRRSKVSTSRVKGPRELNRFHCSRPPRIGNTQRDSSSRPANPCRNDSVGVPLVLFTPCQTHAGPIFGPSNNVVFTSVRVRCTRYKRYNTGLSTTHRTLIDPVVQHNVGDD